MRKPWIVSLVVVAGSCGWLGHRAFSADAPPGTPPPGMPSEAEMEKLMTELATPGEMHKWLAEQEGSWEMTLKTHGMDGKVEESKATATIKMILGGRFQEQRVSGTMMGKPFEGFGLTGYDNFKKEFVNYWFDTMGTSPSIGKGQRSADGKSLTLSGVWEMPGTPMTFKMVSTRTSATEMGFKMTGTMGGQEMPMMEATYTRK